jgi:hypothetical protein
MKPSIARMVHYVSYGTPNGEYPSVCRAAIVAAVGREADSLPEFDETRSMTQELDLCVFNPEGMFFKQGVPQNEPIKAGGTWHWPERVE